MIALENISKKFNSKIVVDNISIKIKKGEIVGLLGPNGAGKTTTIRMITGVLPPTKGNIKIDGIDLEAEPALKKRIGFLPENNPLYDEMTVEENLNFWSAIKGISKNKKKEAIEFVVENCGIAEVFYRPINELSKGYRQRVGFSQAILTKPDILILDEPTEGLDPNQRQDISNLIRQLGKDRTVIISSHVLGELSKIANRMVIIHKGRVVADDTPDNLKKFGKGSLTVEIEVKGKRVMSFIKKIDGVIKVIKQRKNYYIIEVDKRYDVREKLYKLSVENGWTLLTLFSKERAIEDVFSELTSN